MTNKPNNRYKLATTSTAAAKQSSSSQQQQKPKQRTQRNSSSMTTQSENERSSGKATTAMAKARKEPPPVQCLGPECVKAAVAGSKYCSHECGMRLAKVRFAAYLQTRYTCYTSSGPCLADQINMNELERIAAEIGGMQAKLAELEEAHKRLDQVIERASFAKIDPNVEVCWFTLRHVLK